MIEKVKIQVEELLGRDDSGHGMDHINRVVDLACRFALKEKADREVVSLIALLHDVDDYKLFGMDSAKNLTNARKIMTRCGVEDTTQEQVCLALNNIGYSKRLKGFCPTTLEGRIVSDADMCDALGATGILRVQNYGLKINRPFFDKNVFPKEDSSYEYHLLKSASTVNFIFEVLFRYLDLMLTEAGKEEAKKRYDIMFDFLRNFFQEENASLWLEYLDKWIQDFE